MLITLESWIGSSFGCQLDSGPILFHYVYHNYKRFPVHVRNCKYKYIPSKMQPTVVKLTFAYQKQNSPQTIKRLQSTILNINNSQIKNYLCRRSTIIELTKTPCLQRHLYTRNHSIIEIFLKKTSWKSYS